MADLPVQHDDRDDRPGHGFLKWLGRQVGYVAKAINTDPAQEAKVVYRNGRVEELPHPLDPNLKLRRTTIDEVVAEGTPPPKAPTDG
jgi:hypothetical protein